MGEGARGVGNTPLSWGKIRDEPTEHAPKPLNVFQSTLSTAGYLIGKTALKVGLVGGQLAESITAERIEHKLSRIEKLIHSESPSKAERAQLEKDFNRLTEIIDSIKGAGGTVSADLQDRVDSIQASLSSKIASLGDNAARKEELASLVGMAVRLYKATGQGQPGAIAAATTLFQTPLSPDMAQKALPLILDKNILPELAKDPIAMGNFMEALSKSSLEVRSDFMKVLDQLNPSDKNVFIANIAQKDVFSKILTEPHTFEQLQFATQLFQACFKGNPHASSLKDAMALLKEAHLSLARSEPNHDKKLAIVQQYKGVADAVINSVTRQLTTAQTYELNSPDISDVKFNDIELSSAEYLNKLSNKTYISPKNVKHEVNVSRELLSLSAHATEDSLLFGAINDALTRNANINPTALRKADTQFAQIDLLENYISTDPNPEKAKAILNRADIASDFFTDAGRKSEVKKTLNAMKGRLDKGGKFSMAQEVNDAIDDPELNVTEKVGDLIVPKQTLRDISRTNSQIGVYLPTLNRGDLGDVEQAAEVKRQRDALDSELSLTNKNKEKQLRDFELIRSQRSDVSTCMLAIEAEKAISKERDPEALEIFANDTWRSMPAVGTIHGARIGYPNSVTKRDGNDIHYCRCQTLSYFNAQDKENPIGVYVVVSEVVFDRNKLEQGLDLKDCVAMTNDDPPKPRENVFLQRVPVEVKEEKDPETGEMGIPKSLEQLKLQINRRSGDDLKALTTKGLEAMPESSFYRQTVLPTSKGA